MLGTVLKPGNARVSKTSSLFSQSSQHEPKLQWGCQGINNNVTQHEKYKCVLVIGQVCAGLLSIHCSWYQWHLLQGWVKIFED